MSIAPNDATMIDIAFLLVIYSPRKILAKISIKKDAVWFKIAAMLVFVFAIPIIQKEIPK